MAGGTIRAEACFVCIVSRVAADALTGRVAVQHRGLVAIRAGRVQMAAYQEKIGQPVIKRCFVQFHNIGIATFMIGVAACARICTRCWGFSVKSCLRKNVAGDFLVAVEA